MYVHMSTDTYVPIHTYLSKKALYKVYAISMGCVMWKYTEGNCHSLGVFMNDTDQNC